MESILYQPLWRVIDQSTLGPSFEAKQSFAIDDALCHSVGYGESSCIARTWVHHNTIILGIQDSRLPHLKDGLDYLASENHHYVVRNSGGLAVVLDEGVLNISLIFPEREHNVSIDQGYEAMVDFVRKMLHPYGVVFEDREIVGSYCPGRYDLSVGGKKFAGISQRRLRRGVAVQIYLCVDGSGSKRAEVVGEFYKRSLKGEVTRFEYPVIKPETMASLSELTGKPLTVREIMNQFYQTLQRFGSVVPSGLTEDEAKRFDDYYRRMIERNEKAFDFN
ncbi:octanoyl-[GcvH]:protein N-octanoyltransferase [Scopulibacillus darangshiensis]|uniref:Octanoyl-[GcvH]:protein N-octanoyltransferase n=1 Tax=Scopulibacillus darangshiensis TaxID=442528 RepID=A0A4R2NHV0_9BACL|nr:biotin/lipoate A/B protein ligase family protein [Scopulibacillus darangshiensis]TCP20951.1 octanoyl-[GcvH]:protein N-octanoyltransferase [Scopulibacillus darangshiensis]